MRGIWQKINATLTAQKYFEQSRHFAAATGNAYDECRALIGLGTVAHDRGDFATAFDLIENAARIARSIGDQRSIAMALSNMRAIRFYQGKLAVCELYWIEAQAIVAALG